MVTRLMATVKATTYELAFSANFVHNGGAFDSLGELAS